MHPVSSGGQVWIGSHPGHLVGSLIRPPGYISIHNEAALRSGRQVERVAPPGGTSRDWSTRACGASSGFRRHGTPVFRRGANGRRRRHRPNGRACSRGRAAGCSSSPQRAGWRSAGSGRAACRRECRHAAHSRPGLQGQLQQLVDPRHEVDGDSVPQVVAEILVDCLRLRRGRRTRRNPPGCAASTFRRCRRPGAPVRRG